MKKLPKGFKEIGPPMYEHQYKAFLFGIERKNTGLLLDIGLGKSHIAIDISRYFVQLEKARKVLIVCPSSLLDNWKREIEKFSEYSALILHGTREERIKKLSQKNYRFYIINYEALYPFLKELLDLNFNIIIFDESARYIKNPMAQRTKASILLADRANHKMLLTATPLDNKPLDIWSQFRAMNGGKTFSTNYYKFRNIFFFPVSIGPGKKWLLRKGKISLIRRLIYSDCIRIKKEEAIELPEKIFQVIKLELESGLEEIYRDVEREVIAEVETSKGTASLTITSILTRLLRLQQITSGFIGEKGKEKKLKIHPKLDALIEQVGPIIDVGESAIIWCRFLKSIDLIKNALQKEGIKSITMSGSDSAKKKDEKWYGFQRSKEINVFIAQEESGGFGIELFKIDTISAIQHSIFYENVWNPSVKKQAMGRSHRTGQKSICRFVDLIVKDTIDQRILDMIKKKKDIAQEILEKGIRRFLH